MRLLDRYLLRELLAPLGICLGGLSTFWIAADLFTRAGTFQKNKLLFRDIVEYYLVRFPEVLAQIMPIALLLALLYALTSHARHNELTAIRTAGVSLWRACIPYFAVGLLFSIGTFALNEVCVPGSSALASQIMVRRLEEREDAPGKAATGVFFKNTRANRAWEIDSYDLKTHLMTRPKIYSISADGSMRQLTAERGERTNNVWTFYVVEERVRSNETSLPVLVLQTNVLSLPELSETPEEINRKVEFMSRLNLRSAYSAEIPVIQIVGYLKRYSHDLSERDLCLLHTQLWGRLASPWTCLVVVVIAIPFGAASGRRNIFAGVASSIVICFAYFVLSRLGLALGAGGVIPPWMAAWLPNVTFAGVGCWMFLRTG